MRLLSWLLWPLRVLLRALRRPFERRAARRILKDGWAELWLEGAVLEQRTPSKIPAIFRRWMGTEEEPSVSLARVRRFVSLFVADPRAKGLFVRLGSLGGGWAAAGALRSELLRVSRAGKPVLVHLKDGADNRGYYVATGGTRILASPTTSIAPTGTAASTVFLKDALDRAGIGVEVASAGRFKSAPEAFTRADRSENDLEQTRALVDAVDEALADAISERRGVDRASARARMDEAPMVATRAKLAGLIDGTARDEDIPLEVKSLAGAEKPPTLVGAGSYLDVRDLEPIVPRRRKRVAIVEVHGAIVDRATPYSSALDRVAVERSVVSSLRAALAAKDVGAIVLHVQSPGGSVTASDTIYGAVRRANEEKPVVACFFDVAASGGYYVACGARAIVASPLTVTGSIGVFSMAPIAAALAKRLSLHQDVVKNRAHADLYNPLRARTPEEQAHVEREVLEMYELFVGLVARARDLEVAKVKEVAEGRVWTGRDAERHRLVDGLGGMEEALDRARRAAGGAFDPDPVIFRSRRGHVPRPDPVGAAMSLLPRELLELAAVQAASPRALAVAYAPWSLLG